jgi:8-oxo-dGTP diphosphatase
VIGLRRRSSARLLITDPTDRLLLFHFVHRRGALAGQSYWATPGGAVEEGETFAQAAVRELHEETGFQLASAGDSVARREFELQLPDGEWVIADERYFRVAARHGEISRAGWTALELEIMSEHRWWSRDEIRGSAETIYPPDLADMI